MKYAYDSWNRIQNITYPDGEVVHYKYNTGGMLDRVYGQAVVSNSVIIKGVIPGPSGPIVPSVPTTTYTYNYIDSIRYNEFELKSAILYGNGTSAQYSYDILNRLSRLKLYDAANNYLQNITYSYDAVGNIDAIQNTADRISGSNLGGTYTYTYKYDDLYRLTTAIGSTNIRVRATESTGFTRIQYASYTQRMRYDKDGKILSKTQTSRTSLNGSDTYSNTANDYIYNSGQPHTVRATSASEFRWDANGNMIEQDAARMSWDEENQLREYSNRRSLAVAFYQYDAGGERFYKNTGERTTLVVNGRRVEMPYYHIPTLYTSPYLVATPQGYTKHYFMESERFASRIGDGTITSINNHVTTDAVIAAKQAEVNTFVPDSTQARLLEGLRNLPFNWSSHHTTFWQHGDHLGSASWVTDTNGAAYQHLQYMPWGEPLLDQRKSGYTYNTRYTFSGKERDEETGYSYFGARYYNSSLSIWLSVDPMTDKYPSLSPYVYCADNPVRLVDVDGREIGDYFNLNGDYLGSDGIDDGKVYVVTGRPNGSPWANPRMQYDEDDIHRVPASKENRARMVNALIEFDKKNPNAEWGGLCGDVLDNKSEDFGTEQIVWGTPGDAGDPCAHGTTIAYRQTQDYGYNGYGAFFDFHTHGSGKCEGSPAWIQAPSDIDRDNTYQRQQQTYHRSFAVFAMSDKSVHLYNGKRNCGSMSFEIFINISR